MKERVKRSASGSIRSIVQQLSRLALDQMSYSVSLQDIESALWHTHQMRAVFPLKATLAFISRSKCSALCRLSPLDSVYRSFIPPIKNAPSAVVYLLSDTNEQVRSRSTFRYWRLNPQNVYPSVSARVNVSVIRSVGAANRNLASHSDTRCPGGRG